MSDGCHRRFQELFATNGPTYWLAVIAVVLVCVVPIPASCMEKDCKEVQQEFERKKQRMSEYITAMQKFNQQDDVEILGAMNLKISELATQMRQLEKDVAECHKQLSRSGPQGVSVVKSDEGLYSTVPCGDLRKKMIILTQKAHTLKKRRQSMLSELTAIEKKELQEVSQDLQAVRDALKTRCAPAPTPKPFRRESLSVGRN